MTTLDEIVLTDRDRRAIRDASAVLRELLPIDHIVLFGSKARGTGDRESDIDLLVLTERELSWEEHDSALDALFDIELRHDVVISALIVPGSEWREGAYQVLPICEEVERDGVPA